MPTRRARGAMSAVPATGREVGLLGAAVGERQLAVPVPGPVTGRRGGDQAEGHAVSGAGDGAGGTDGQLEGLPLDRPPGGGRPAGGELLEAQLVAVGAA